MVKKATAIGENRRGSGLPTALRGDMKNGMLLTSLTRFRDFGLLLMRFGLGGMMIFHGFPKLAGGTETWVKLGGAMKHVGIDVFPVFWGFMAAFAECFGGLFLILGLFCRPALILLAITMVVATAKTMGTADGKAGWAGALKEAAHPLSLAVVFTSLIFVGPGRYSFDKN